jgi:hypothetical protein
MAMTPDEASKATVSLPVELEGHEGYMGNIV